MVFCVLALLQLGHALGVRSERQSFFRLGWRTNVPLVVSVAGLAILQLSVVEVPFLQPFFETQPLSPIELAVVLLASTAAFVGVETEKWLFRRRAARADSVASLSGAHRSRDTA
jgi:Ca2+-transporting ATPase